MCSNYLVAEHTGTLLDKIYFNGKSVFKGNYNAIVCAL